MKQEIKCEQLISGEGKPIFYITAGATPIAKVLSNVATSMKTTDDRITLYKDGEKIMEIWRYIDTHVPIHGGRRMA